MVKPSNKTGSRYSLELHDNKQIKTINVKRYGSLVGWLAGSRAVKVGNCYLNKKSLIKHLTPMGQGEQIKEKSEVVKAFFANCKEIKPEKLSSKLDVVYAMLLKSDNYAETYQNNPLHKVEQAAEQPQQVPNNPLLEVEPATAQPQRVSTDFRAGLSQVLAQGPRKPQQPAAAVRPKLSPPKRQGNPQMMGELAGAVQERAKAMGPSRGEAGAIAWCAARENQEEIQEMSRQLMAEMQTRRAEKAVQQNEEAMVAKTIKELFGKIKQLERLQSVLASNMRNKIESSDTKQQQLVFINQILDALETLPQEDAIIDRFLTRINAILKIRVNMVAAQRRPSQSELTALRETLVRLYDRDDTQKAPLEDKIRTVCRKHLEAVKHLRDKKFPVDEERLVELKDDILYYYEKFGEGEGDIEVLIAYSLGEEVSKGNIYTL